MLCCFSVTVLSLTNRLFGQFAYVVNSGDNTVSGYTINARSGALTPIPGSPFAAGSYPRSVAVDPAGRFAYVTNASAANVTVYTINATSGALTPILGSPFAAGAFPNSVAVDPAGKFAYVANTNSYDISGFTINATSGALTPILGSPFPARRTPVYVAADPTGRFAYVTNADPNNVSGYAINATTGVLTPIPGSPFATGDAPTSVAVDPTGQFAYVANYLSSEVSGYSIEPTTGALTPIPGSPFATGTAPYSVAVDPAGKFVYVANSGSNEVSGYTIHAPSGTLTPILGSPFAAGASPTSVAVDPAGKFVYVVDNDFGDVSVYTINATTGDLTPIPGSPFPAGSGPTGIAVANLTSFIVLTPSSLTFPPQPVGTSSPAQQATLRNTGNVALNITNIVASGDFAQTNDCPSAVARAGFCTLSVTFTPTATGIRTGGVTITDNAPGSPHQLPLAGTGGIPAVSLRPASLTFASQAVGTTSPAQPTTLNNTGSGPLSITSIAASGDFAQTSNCGSVVNPGASCTLNVTFTPTATGTRTGSISITDDAAGSPHHVSLTGTGAVGQGAVTLTPASLTFVAQPVGTFSAAQLATLKNTGVGTLKITSIGRSGDFYEGNNCPTTLAAGASCTLSVKFTPTSPGPKAGSVTITDNAPGSPQQLRLTGTGSGTGSIILQLSPGSLSFGGVVVGTASSPQMVTLTNIGTVAASFSEPFGFATTGTNWNDFHKNPWRCGLSLAPGKSCTVSVFFKPLAAGTRTGFFLVRQGAASKQIPLSGTGTP
jgi:DNA-binding beta-propeller fold protein YncE